MQEVQAVVPRGKEVGGGGAVAVAMWVGARVQAVVLRGKEVGGVGWWQLRGRRS